MISKAGVTPMGSKIEELCSLAAKIWTEHYEPMLTVGQVPYMLEKYQSPKAVKEQIKNGYDYFFLTLDGKNVGYIGIQPENEKLFLSKIYVDKPARGHGVAKTGVDFSCEYGKAKNLKSVYLTVNKYNYGSIAAYKKMGFKTIDSVVTDIGNGYVMDDFIMEKTIL